MSKFYRFFTIGFLVLALFSVAEAGKKSGLEGKVVDGNGKPLAGIKVIAKQEQPIKGYEQSETTTSSSGVFTLNKLYPSSIYTLYFSAKTWTTNTSLRVNSGPAGETSIIPSAIVIDLARARQGVGSFVDPQTGLAWFIASSDGTVTDRKTGLEWQQQDNGNTMMWQDAINYCENLSLGGQGKWRLPSIDELMSLVDRQRMHTIDPIFTGTKPSYYWSSIIASADGTSGAWRYGFGGDYAFFDSKTPYNSFYVRCVRTQTKEYSTPNAIFKDNGNGTVTESKSKLIWQKQDDGKVRNWQDAIDYCKSLSLGGQSNWHLPSKDELLTLVNIQKNPAIDPIFTITDKDWSYYWSSTTYASNVSSAWSVFFVGGVASDSNKIYGNYYVRCVR